MTLWQTFLGFLLLGGFTASTSWVSGAVTANAGAAVSGWIKFEDPYEHAFTAEVPQGWTVKGGIFRLGYSDSRPMLDMISPDGKTQIRFGDVAIPSYSVPNQYHAREGEPYDLGAQAQMTVARYRSGQDFAQLYAIQRFVRLCQKLDPQAADTTSPVRDYVPPGAPSPSQSSGGQVNYRCDTSQGARVAYVYAKTSLFGSLWQVTSLASFLAPPEGVADARAILLHASQTFQLIPEWIERQKQMDAEGLQYQRARQQQRLYALGQQVQQFEQRMHAMQNQVNAFERQQNAQARQVESFGNLLTGIQPTTDPLGNERDAWIGPNSNYWTNGTGTIVNSNNPPGAGWQQLKPHD
jgi:hypothetical protein